MYVSTFLRLFTSRLPLVTKWSAVKSAASAVSAPRVKEKEGAGGGGKGAERRRGRAKMASSFLFSPVWSRRFLLLADENRLSPAVLRRGCTENEIALGSVCIIFRG